MKVVVKPIFGLSILNCPRLLALPFTLDLSIIFVASATNSHLLWLLFRTGQTILNFNQNLEDHQQLAKSSNLKPLL